MGKRIAILLIALVATTMAVRAQESEDEGEWVPRSLSAGVRIGSNVGDIRLTADCYDDYSHVWTPKTAAAVWMHYRTNFGLGLRPQVGYVGRGAHLKWADVDYRMTVHTLDLRLGLTYNFKMKKTKLSPYIIVAPAFTMAMGGNVHYESLDAGEVKMGLTKASVAQYDVDLYAGAGLDVPLPVKNTAICLSFEVGYCMGFMESFTAAEHSGELTVLNRTLDTQPAMGDRLAQGIEATVGIGVPFGPKLKKKRPDLKKILEN